MFCKIMLTLACLMVLVNANPALTSMAYIVSLEEPCVRQGGICMRSEDCDVGNQVSLPVSLCPMQARLGVQCCYI